MKLCDSVHVCMWVFECATNLKNLQWFKKKSSSTTNRVFSKGTFRDKVNVGSPVFFTRNLSYIFEKNKTKTNLAKEIELMTSENESLRKNQISWKNKHLIQDEICMFTRVYYEIMLFLLSIVMSINYENV